MVDSWAFTEAEMMPLIYQFGYYDDTASAWAYWGEAYGEEIPIWPDANGNLCTNMWEEVDIEMTRIFLAFNDGLFDTTIAAIDENTLPEDYPVNVSNIVSFFSQESFDWLFEYQVQVDGTDADGACTECVDFTSYWDFLTAVARVPSFCNGTPGGMYSRFEDAQMCAKEMAGMLAVMITQTNTFDDTKVDANSDAVEYVQQGLSELQDAACDETSELADDYCVAMDDATTRDPFFDGKTLDTGSVGFVPRGAGYIYGAD